MRVSLTWLQQYVDIQGLSPEAIAEALTNSGLEVESIETVGGQFSGVRVGKIIKVEPHPNADRLRLVTVDLGASGQNQVVCGAPNVAEGLRIAYAQIGAKVINRKEGGLFELKPATIRGIQSTGMICSLPELGLEEQYPSEEDGIWPLNSLLDESTIGLDLKEALSLDADTVLDVAPNANRGDLMSMIGVAREVAALFERPLKLQEPPSPDSGESTPYPVQLSHPEVCSFYVGGVLEHITIAPSPDWLKTFLTNAGIRPINNVVDITNYVMLEYGQPLHAFDLGKLGDSGTLGVRPARDGETLKTLDGTERALSAPNVVVTFNDLPVALAGVMGGESTEISDNTQRVLLESAFFPSASNRKNARAAGIRTESSARFERGVDPARCQTAFYRAVELLTQLAGARFIGAASEDHRQLKTLVVPLSAERIRQILGVDIPGERVEQSLTSLGFEIKSVSAGHWEVTVPTFRQHDVSRPIDLIEEVIRIYGYENIPYTLPKETAAPVVSLRAELLQQIRHIMTGCGLSEVTTQSLIGDALLGRTGFRQDPQTTVGVTNSQSQDHTILRQSLLPNLLETAHYNQAQGNEAFWLFELGKTYIKRRHPEEKYSGVEETLLLSGILMNAPSRGTWHLNAPTDFYTVKGVVDNLLLQLGLSEHCVWTAGSENPVFHPGQVAEIKLGKAVLGAVGRIHPERQLDMKFRAPLYLFELNVEALYKAVKNAPRDLRGGIPVGLSVGEAGHRLFSAGSRPQPRNLIRVVRRERTLAPGR